MSTNFEQNNSAKNLLLLTIKGLLSSSEFEEEVKERLQYLDGHDDDRDMLFNFIKGVVWDELFRKNLTQNVPISLYWYKEDFSQELDSYIHQFIATEIVAEAE